MCGRPAQKLDPIKVPEGEKWCKGFAVPVSTGEYQTPRARSPLKNVHPACQPGTHKADVRICSGCWWRPARRVYLWCWQQGWCQEHKPTACCRAKGRSPMRMSGQLGCVGSTTPCKANANPNKKVWPQMWGENRISVKAEKWGRTRTNCCNGMSPRRETSC